MYILFPHGSEISESINIEWVQAEIKPSDALIKPDRSWEHARTNLYGSVIKHENASAENLYEMFYQCGNALRLARAVSKDGLEWRKELINLTDYSTEAEGLTLKSVSQECVDSELELTNIVASCHMPSLMYREGENRPYKLFAFGREGYTTFDSVDGKSFDVVADPAIEMAIYDNEFTEKKWVSDVAPCFVDGNEYIAMAKTYEIDDQERTRRCVGRIESKDLVSWSDVKTLWVPGESEDRIAQSRGFQWADFYGLCPFKYGEGYLGFLWLFEIEKELPKGTNQGKIEVFLASSPDGLTWSRLSDKAFIPWDLNFGERGGMVTTSSMPIFEENEIRVYYSDSNFEHGYHEKEFDKIVEKPTWDIRCAQLPKERLVGAYSKQGKLLVFTGSLNRKMLRLNADTEGGALLIRYRSCGEVVGEHAVEDINDTDIYIEPLGAESNELEICLRDATLYAIEVI